MLEIRHRTNEDKKIDGYMYCESYVTCIDDVDTNIASIEERGFSFEEADNKIKK